MNCLWRLHDGGNMNGLVILLGGHVHMHMTHGMVGGARGGRKLKILAQTLYNGWGLALYGMCARG